jgi:hypothetical protein
VRFSVNYAKYYTNSDQIWHEQSTQSVIFACVYPVKTSYDVLLPPGVNPTAVKYIYHTRYPDFFNKPLIAQKVLFTNIQGEMFSECPFTEGWGLCLQ